MQEYKKGSRTISVSLPSDVVDMVRRLQLRLGLRFSWMARAVVLQELVDWAQPRGRDVKRPDVPKLGPEEMERLKAEARLWKDIWETTREGEPPVRRGKRGKHTVGDEKASGAYPGSGEADDGGEELDAG